MVLATKGVLPLAWSSEVQRYMCVVSTASIHIVAVDCNRVLKGETCTVNLAS